SPRGPPDLGGSVPADWDDTMPIEEVPPEGTGTLAGGPPGGDHGPGWIVVGVVASAFVIGGVIGAIFGLRRDTAGADREASTASSPVPTTAPPPSTSAQPTATAPPSTTPPTTPSTAPPTAPPTTAATAPPTTRPTTPPTTAGASGATVTTG